MAALMDPGQHARSISYVDPVATWKEAALERARLDARHQQAAQKPYLRMRVTFGFLLAVGRSSEVVLSVTGKRCR